MTEQANVAIVQGIYAAFGRGDLASILKLLAPDARWTWYGPPEIPFAGERQGPEQIASFFAALGQTVDIQEFDIREFIAQGEQVVVIGRERVRVKSTEHVYEGDWAMVWTLRDGKVVEEREFHNTYAVVAALRAV